MQQESGLWKRGLVLFGLLGGLAAVVLYTILHQPEAEAPVAPGKPEPLVLAVGAPSAGLVGTLPWGALLEVGEMLPSPPGWEIRYNATLALARRGSLAVRLDVLREMLDEHRQLQNFRGNPDATVAARRTVVNALKAVRDWHKHPHAVHAVPLDDVQLSLLYAAVDQLADSPNRVLSTEAQATRRVLKKG
jgi:hypothetical protein